MNNEQEVQQPFGGARRAAGYVEAPTTRADVEDVVSPAPAEPPVAEVVPISGAGETTEQPELQGDALVYTPGDDLSVVTTDDRPTVATEGLRGVLSKLGIRMAPGIEERARLQAEESLRRDEQTIRQATWTRAQGVLIANRKGGTGKTPTAIGVGGVLAAVRGGSVAIMEVSDDRGGLSFRAEGSPKLGMGELVRDVDKIRSAGQLAGYTAPQTSFAAVIGSVGNRPPLTGEDVEAVSRVIDEYYGIRVMDSGNQPSSSAFQAAVATADALVVPVFNSADSVLEAIDLLDLLRSSGAHAAQLAENAVIIRITDGRPEYPQIVERLDRLITGARVREVHAVPFDQHIAERGQITLDKLSPAARRAFTAATAAVVRSLQAVAN